MEDDIELRQISTDYFKTFFKSASTNMEVLDRVGDGIHLRVSEA